MILSRVGFVLLMERWLLHAFIRPAVVTLRRLHRFGVVQRLMVLAMAATSAATWSRLVLSLLTRHPTIVVQSTWPLVVFRPRLPVAATVVWWLMMLIEFLRSRRLRHTIISLSIKVAIFRLLKTVLTLHVCRILLLIKSFRIIFSSQITVLLKEVVMNSMRCLESILTLNRRPLLLITWRVRILAYWPVLVLVVCLRIRLTLPRLS